MRCEVVAVAPSCCSGRSSTPTRRGSASSWPWPASTARTSRPGRRQPRPHRRRAASWRSAGRRGDRVRRARADAGRHHPRRHRRGDGRARWSRDDDVVERILERVRARGAGGCRPTTCARPTGPGGRDGHRRPAARHRARADLPGGRQGDLRRPGRALRDAGDRDAGRSCPTCARRAGTVAVIRSPHAAHLGRERVGPGRAPGRPHRSSSTPPGRAPHAGLPRQRHRGPQGAHHGQGRRRGRPRPRLLEAEEARCVRDILGDIVFGVDDETMEHAVGDAAGGAGA